MGNLYRRNNELRCTQIDCCLLFLAREDTKFTAWVHNERKGMASMQRGGPDGCKVAEDYLTVKT